MERQEQILLSLKKLDFLSRSQLQRLHDLKSDRNAQRVLKDMEQYLNRFNDGQNIYYLNKAGRDIVGCEIIRKRTGNVDHYLMRNDVFLLYNAPADWKNEIKMSLTNKGKAFCTVIADAYFLQSGKHHIVEIDNTQTMKKNREKIDKYRRLIQHNVFKGMPKLIWVTKTRYRQRQLKMLCEGLDHEVYLNTDFK